MNTNTQACAPIALTAVKSSQITAIGHDPATNTLAIQFPPGKVSPGSLYHYQNFTAEQFAAFAGAESIGSHFGKHIKPHADLHPYTKILPPVATELVAAQAADPITEAAEPNEAVSA